MGAFDGDVGAGKGKAAGRDYLMELLKKQADLKQKRGGAPL